MIGELSFLVVGDGALSARINAALRECGSSRLQRWSAFARRDIHPGLTLALGICEVPQLDELVAASEVCAGAGIPFLPIHADFGDVFMGPLRRPGEAGCLRCADERYLNCVADRDVELAARAEAIRLNVSSPSIGHATSSFIVKLVEAMIQDWIDDQDAMSPRVTIVNLASLVVSTHRFLPLADCKICGVAAPLDGVPTVPHTDELFAPGKWRVRDYSNALAPLRAELVDPRMGILTVLGTDLRTPLCAIGTAHLRIGQIRQDAWTGGLSDCFDRSQTVAMLEALERYACVTPLAKPAPIRGCLAMLPEPALDPASLTLYSESQYARPGFPCVPFGSDVEMSWVRGWSWRTRKPVLVPEQAVYYDAARVPPGERIVIESSSGCASGGSFEEAVFYAALELLERDAALRTWYARKPPPRLDLDAIADRDLRLAVDRFRQVTGFEIYALDITQEFGIPTVWILAVGRNGDGRACLSATKCHPDPLTAVAGACYEVFGGFHSFVREYPDKRSRLLQMFADPELVVEQLDHVYLATLPEAFANYEFLMDGPNSGTTGTVFDVGNPKHDPVRDISRLFGQVLEVAGDVIVVEQTAPEQRRWDLHAAKVLAPGLLPLTIGHGMIRIADSPRLAGLDGINPWPHPFP